MTTDLRKWVSFGTGVGIDIGEKDLDVTIVRVRPHGIAVLGSASVPDFRERPAAEWGAELTEFLKKLGCGHIAATILLPRHDVIVRQVQMPGVADKDLGAALQFQIDGLHPFADQEVRFSYARVGKTPTVLVGICRREVVDRYSTLFAEAGIKAASLTFSAAALYTAIRILNVPPQGFVATQPRNGDLEVYGESEHKPVFSASVDKTAVRAVTLAAAELRLPPGAEPSEFRKLLPSPVVFPPNHDPSGEGFGQHTLPYATALAGACPWLSIDGNLLPADLRRGSSRIRWIPTIVLGSALVLIAGALAAQSSFENKRYLNLLQTEIRTLEPQARRADAIDKSISASRARTQLLDDFRRRSKADMDALNELTRTIPQPGFVNNLDINRNTVQLTGEAEQAEPLLKAIDASPLFANSEFVMGITRTATGEVFSIRAQRERQSIPQPPPAGASK